MQPKNGKPPRSARLAAIGVEPSQAALVRLSWMDYYRTTKNVALTCRIPESRARPFTGGSSAMSQWI
jgi:hypothetical protein